MMDQPKRRKRPEMNRHFALIEAVIVAHGGVTRIHLQRAFDIAEAQATRIFSSYRALHPNNIALDNSDKLYKPMQTFRPVELEKFCVNAERFLDAAQVLAGQQIVQLRTTVR